MILSRLRNVSHCRSHMGQNVDILARRQRGLPGRPVSHTVFYRYHYSFGNFRHWFFHVVFSPGAVGVVQRIVFRSSLWFASLGLYWSWSLAQDTRVFLQSPGGLYPGPPSVDIHTSLAGGFLRSSVSPLSFFLPFPHLNVSVSPAHFLIACFRHIAPRFLFWSPRDRVCTKGVDEAIYIQNKSSLPASAQPCVYDDPTVVQVARHNSPTSTTIRLPCLFMCALRATCRASISNFLCSWILGLS